MVTIGFISQKGGQGKTTLSNALAYSLKEQNKKVLLVDFDSQASQTIALGLNPLEFSKPGHESNITNMFRRADVVPIKIDENIDLLPANPDLWSVSESAPAAKEMMLKRFLTSVSDRYDYAIVDTKGGASTLMNNVIIASDTLVIPVVTSFLDEAATGDLLNIIETIAEAYDMQPKRFVLIPSQFNKSTLNDRETIANINNVAPASLSKKAFCKDVTVTVPFPRKTVVASAFAFSPFLQPYIKTASKGIANELFLALEDIAKKIIQK